MPPLLFTDQFTVSPTRTVPGLALQLAVSGIAVGVIGVALIILEQLFEIDFPPEVTVTVAVLVPMLSKDVDRVFPSPETAPLQE